MKFVKVKYDKGSLGKNIGAFKAPDILLDEVESEEVDIENNVDKVMENIAKKEGYFFVGGDHSITYGSFNGFAKRFKNPGIIIFDAHPDCYPEEFINHENWVYCLVNEEVLKKEN